jgi:hypothetical protein
MSSSVVGGPVSGGRWQVSRLGDDVCSLIVSPMLDTFIGVKATEVIRIEYERDRAAGQDEAKASTTELDLCQLLGLRWPRGMGMRCSLLVWSGSDRVRLLAGTNARVVALPCEQIRPLPALLAGLRERAAIGALVLANRRLGIIIENSLLPGIAVRSAGREAAGREVSVP